MTKKQLGIICTLLALIACTGLLAAKLNKEGLNESSDLSAALITNDTSSSNTNEDSNKDTETISKTDFFYNARSEREQSEASTIQQLKSISESANASKEQKTSAINELQKIALKQDKEKKIEANIKNKGYDECLCEISEDQTKASVIVQSTTGLDEKAGAEIQEVVQNTSNIKEVTIEVKK
ncbi:MAG: SpoIIIAH-like family protein [Clostridium sp.]|nr:SpoIIIAH-like family protein [Clostridium sp.]